MGTYPETDDGLAALFTAPGSDDEEKWDGPYLKSPATVDELRDPWNKAFEYASPGKIHETGYDMWSRGLDGIDDEGSEDSDDIKNWISK